MTLENVFIVLVRPQFLGNLGSVARVMKNFSLTRLRLVDAPRNYKDAEARKMSVGAFDVLKNAELFDSLEAALADVTLALGTTSGKQREFEPEPLPQLLPTLIERAPNNACAIVFGDEVNGLSRDELQRCHHVITIPTNSEFPALNISQAVGICAYELSRSINDKTSESVSYSTGAADSRLFEELDKLLQHSEFLRTFNRDKVLAELRSFYQRAHPTSRETELLTGALIRLNQKLH